MKKKATTPVFKSNEIFQKSYPIPWLATRDFDLIGYLEHGSIKGHKHLTKIGV